MDENSIVSQSQDTSEYAEIFILPAKPSDLDIFSKMWFQEFYVMKMKIINFWKTTFSNALSFYNLTSNSKSILILI